MSDLVLRSDVARTLAERPESEFEVWELGGKYRLTAKTFERSNLMRQTRGVCGGKRIHATWGPTIESLSESPVEHVRPDVFEGIEPSHPFDTADPFARDGHGRIVGGKYDGCM
jgi:hypothetical protein